MSSRKFVKHNFFTFELNYSKWKAVKRNYLLKSSQTVQSLLASLNTVAADEMQTILTVAEHLQSNLENEMERVKQAQRQYDELLARYEETMKLWTTDKENIRKQRDEIGRKNEIVEFFTIQIQ